jgi:hypothetical protein
MEGRGHLENLSCRLKEKFQHYYSINNLCRFGLDSAGSEQGSKMEGITRLRTLENVVVRNVTYMDPSGKKWK